MNVIERIYILTDIKKDSIYKLSKELGVSNGYFAKQRQSKGAVSSAIIEKIVSYYTDVNVEWLITGKGNILKDTNRTDTELSTAGKEIDNLLNCIGKVNKMLAALNQTMQISSKITRLQLEKYKDIISSVGAFIKETENELEENTKKLAVSNLNSKSITNVITERTKKCNLFIPLLTENLLHLLNETYKESEKE